MNNRFGTKMKDTVPKMSLDSNVIIESINNTENKLTQNAGKQVLLPWVTICPRRQSNAGNLFKKDKRGFRIKQMGCQEYTHGASYFVL